MKKIFFTLTIIGVTLVLQSCIVSRTERPKLTGFVYDNIDKTPLNGCKVGESITDTSGYYELKEKRYISFTFIGMEAPPVFIHEVIGMDGYINDTIREFSTFGGGARRGVHWEIDTVYLKRKL